MEKKDVRQEAEEFVKDLQEKPIVVKMQVKRVIDANKEEENLYKTIKEESRFNDGHIHVVISEDMAIGKNFKESFFVVIVKKDGKWWRSSTVYHSIENAMLGLLEYKYEGLNSQFSMFASRMLGID